MGRYLKNRLRSWLLTRARVASGDDFIANLWKVHCRVKEEGYVQASRS